MRKNYFSLNAFATKVRLDFVTSTHIWPRTDKKYCNLDRWSASILYIYDVGYPLHEDWIFSACRELILSRFSRRFQFYWSLVRCSDIGSLWASRDFVPLNVSRRWNVWKMCLFEENLASVTRTTMKCDREFQSSRFDGYEYLEVGSWRRFRFLVCIYERI